MTSLRRSAQEAQRIALEQNLQQNDLSINFDSSVEYPRHLDSAVNGAQGWFDEDHDDEGINPYAGETLSTAAHHASALTLSAGLGLRGHRRDASYATSASGAEYDPDRPVSLLSMDPVFDKSNDLDKLLQSGHQRSVRMRSPLLSYASDTESNRSFTSRPKISDALRNNLTFSPKRPKNIQSSPPISISRIEDSNATPRPRRQHSAPAAPTPYRPDVRVQPPTPGSKLSRAARDSIRQDYRSPAKVAAPSPLRRGVLKSQSSSRIHLPDVTGLTSAVESPAKSNLRHIQYAQNRQRESETRLLAIIGSVQTQLNELEQENSVSRRRVRELETELEDCKREVRRERERVDELGLEAERLRKGKARAREDEGDVSVRYREVVEEKKALEALLQTLHTHLARLTKELQTHQRFLQQLRRLRETDARVLSQRGEDIQNLRDEVGKLGGEVEVLRGVVEDGLRERRARVREQSRSIAADTAMSVDEEEEEDDDSQPEPFDPMSIPGSLREAQQDYEGEGNSTFIHPGRADRTMRTDFATLAHSSPPLGFSGATGQSFIDADELGRISREVEERRAAISNVADDESNNEEAVSSMVSGESPSVIAAARKKERESARPSTSSLPPRPTAPTPNHATARPALAARPLHPSTPVRPSSRAQSQADEYNEEHRQAPSPPPFPQIRGEHMERLFFSAPPHNAKTCKVCHRHEDADGDEHDDEDDESNIRRVKMHLPSRRAHTMKEAMRYLPEPEEDNDFGDEDVDLENEPAIRKWTRQARKQGIPPQTVIARVIRELEDDFTHYKSIYTELADAYKILDAASNVKKRNMLAKHLREVIDILEEKGDQIASLYNLLTFQDSPITTNLQP